LQEIFYLWRPALPDPDDDLLLELAVAAGCQYIVTHNVADFRGTERWGVAAVSPSQFLKLIETAK
jgi:predicted nucleic acid-binding protein